MKNKFNLTEREFERALRKRVNCCPKCGCEQMKILISIGGTWPDMCTATCRGCGHDARSVNMIDAYGTDSALATIVTAETLIKCLKSVLKQYKSHKKIN